MYKAIFTGVGNRGRYWWRQIQGRPDVQVAACVEPAEAMRQRAMKELNIPAGLFYESLDAAIKGVKADFVLDVTPPAVHRQIAEKAFAAGLHVLGEKPISDDYETARQIVAMGTKARRIHMITQNYRFNDCARTLRKALAGGRIGEVGQCDVQFYKAWADAPGDRKSVV